MKTLEERLADAEMTYLCADGSVEQSGCIELDDAIAIVREYMDEMVLTTGVTRWAVRFVDTPPPFGPPPSINEDEKRSPSISKWRACYK